MATKEKTPAFDKAVSTVMGLFSVCAPTSDLGGYCDALEDLTLGMVGFHSPPADICQPTVMIVPVNSDL